MMISIEDLSKYLHMAEIKKNVREYIEDSIKKSIFVALISFCIIYMIGYDENTSIIIASFIGVITFVALLSYPKQKAKKRAKLIEKDLPFMLMSLGVEFNLGVDFEKALRKKANETELGREIDKIVKEVDKKGVSWQQAFYNSYQRIYSEDVKRSFMKIINAYESGLEKQGDFLIEHAKEILAKQKNEIKEFSGKFIMLTLMFITLSAIIPSLLLSYITVGSLFLDIELTPEIIIVFFVVLLPLVNLLILLSIKEKTPVIING